MAEPTVKFNDDTTVQGIPNDNAEDLNQSNDNNKKNVDQSILQKADDQTSKKTSILGSLKNKFEGSLDNVSLQYNRLKGFSRGKLVLALFIMIFHIITTILSVMNEKYVK
jgi:hypothetical protein